MVVAAWTAAADVRDPILNDRRRSFIQKLSRANEETDGQNIGAISEYRDRLKGLYVVARNFFLLLLNISAWPCLAVA